MSMNNPYAQYKQNSVNTATPEELTLMLYNGAIKFSKIAKMKMEEKDIQETSNNLVKSQAIIDELNGTLNMDYELSGNLRELYNFIKEQLVESNIQKDTKILDEIIPIIESMRDTWKEAMAVVKEEKMNPKTAEAN